jgi:hypothetical protein
VSHASSAYMSSIDDAFKALAIMLLGLLLLIIGLIGAIYYVWYT